MYKYLKLIVLSCFIVMIFSSCVSEKPKKYKIGFSQCCVDPWRDMMENEMLREIDFFPEAELSIKVAEDDSKRQIEQIEAFLAEGVDVLIVAPYEAKPLTQIIDKVYQQGIPVILIDRETESENYTAYIGADNYEIGKTAAQYIATQLGAIGEIIEVQMSMSISPARERSAGFRDALKNYPNLKIVKTIEENWDTDAVKENLPQILKQYPNANIIYGHNDKLANHAYQVIRDNNVNNFFIIGVDGRIGKNGGIEMVKNGVLDASLLYPTGGSEAIQVAMTIIKELPINKRNILPTTVIDKEHARIIKHQMTKVQNLQNEISQQIALKENFRQLNNNQYNFILILLSCLILFILLIGFIFRSLQLKKRLNHNLIIKNNEISKQKEQLKDITVELNHATNAKVDFFTNISHEFRTPLTLILGFTDDLLLSSSINPEVQQDVHLIKNNAQRLLRLINQLMDFRKLEHTGMKVKASENDLVAFTSEIIKSYELIAKKRNIELQFATSQNQIMAWFDTSMLDKVIFNLLSNAFKFSKNHSTISISIFVDDVQNNCSIEISDQGIGMNKNTLQHLFDPFFQGDSKNYSGTGIGLSLSKKLMQLQKGDILVQSIKNQGSQFTVLLPLGKEHFSENQIFPIPQNSPYTIAEQEISMDLSLNNISGDKNNPMILIIEDNPDIQFFLQKKLLPDYYIITAIDGQKGKEIAYEQIPDLIICDIKLPNDDGLSITKALKNDLRTSHIPILLLTANSSLEVQIKGAKVGADAYITKPFNFQYLKEKIKNLLLNRQLLKESFKKNQKPKIKKSETNKIDKAFLEHFMTYINNNFHRQDLKTVDLCDELNLSRSQLYRKTKALLGQNIGDYIQTVRLQKAEELLEKGDLSISEIAYEIGYTSPEYFSTVFKNKYGVIPSKYAK